MASNTATYRITCRWPVWLKLSGRRMSDAARWKEDIREKVREYAHLVAETEARIIIIMRGVTPMQLHEALTDWECSDLTDFTVVRRRL